jgi:hypothetical protein
VHLHLLLHLHLPFHHLLEEDLVFQLNRHYKFMFLFLYFLLGLKRRNKCQRRNK